MLRSKRKVTNDERRFYERDPWSNNTFPEINAMIKKLDKRELTKKLYSIGLDQRGDKPKLAKRLKMHYKKIFCDEKSTEDVHVACKYFVCIDFEATCERNNTFNYPHEIIEFPACLVHIESRKIVGEFHSYVRPFRKAHLSDFCMELTGITQEKVDQAPYFPQVFKQFVGWLRSYGLLDQTSDGRVKISKHTPSWTLLTDSPADICKFLAKQCEMDDIAFPYNWASRYCNIKKIFMSVYKPKYHRFTPKIEDMLEILGMEMRGDLHSGKDDARNICRIAIRLIKDGAQIWQNEMYKPNKYNSSAPYYLSKPDHIISEILYADEPWEILSKKKTEIKEENLCEKVAKVSISNADQKEPKSSDSSEEELAEEASQKQKSKVKKGRNYIPKRPPNLALKHSRAQRRLNPTEEYKICEYNDRDGLTLEEQFYADEFIQQTEQMSFGQQALPFSSDQVYLNSPVPFFPETPAFAGPISHMPIYGDSSSPIFVTSPSPMFNAMGPFYRDPRWDLGGVQALTDAEICKRFFLAHPNMTVTEFARLTGLSDNWNFGISKKIQTVRLKVVFEALQKNTNSQIEFLELVNAIKELVLNQAETNYPQMYSPPFIPTTDQQFEMPPMPQFCEPKNGSRPH
ncbi:unnamed protein product [Oikopleura dioica]|uniref:Exonuclease domain-containing protein n=1 Tax=Oikopleura dioica TaxID=34765 RepID=E4XCU3_OIKDI|nr:unnamed protein product [Oikopleura dioica]CBY38652.1 unnamed protein product [Oikopleura dioica]